MMRRQSRICLALITHDDAQRNAYVRPRFAALADQLSGGCAVEALEVAWQPEVEPLGRATMLRRAAMYWHLERSWQRYRGLETPALAPDLARLARRGAADGFGAARDARCRIAAIQMLTADKHLRVWDRFVDSGADALICLENDVVFRADSASRLAAMLAQVLGVSDRPLYADLAGGFEPEALGIAHLLTDRSSLFRAYRRPVTNTTCAYLLTRPLVRELLGALTIRPWLRVLASDWLLNALFVLIAQRAVSCECLHADPTIFVHGSFAGTYRSWQAPAG